MDEYENDSITTDDAASLAASMHGYAGSEVFRPAFRWLCEIVAQTIDAALAGEFDAELAGEIIDLWCEVSEREITTGGSC